MFRFSFWTSFCLLWIFACSPICQDPIPAENLQICQDLAKSFGLPADPGSAPEDPENPPFHPPVTPEFHCGEAEGFHAPANGRECTDGADNDCDGWFDSFDPDCFGNVCAPGIGSRCFPPDICDINLWKCVPPPPPPPRIECGWGGGDPLCGLCPPLQDQETCVVINGVAWAFHDEDRDGLEDPSDNCPWFNPLLAPCPEGQDDSDGDFVPDSVDSCTFVFNPGDPQGHACMSHPEASCGDFLIDGVSAYLRSEINGFPAGWCEFSFPAQISIRLCGLGWTLPADEWTYHDSCLDCAGLEVVEGTMCSLLNGWAEMLLPDEDGDLIPTEYPQGFPRDNCPNTANQDQLDSDGDGIGDVCEDLLLDQGIVPLSFDAGLSD